MMTNGKGRLNLGSVLYITHMQGLREGVGGNLSGQCRVISV